MNIDMDDSRIQGIAQRAQFLNGAPQLVVSTVYRYLRKVTGYQKAQLLRLIKRAVLRRLIRKEYRRVNPNRVYTSITQLYNLSFSVYTHLILRQAQDKIRFFSASWRMQTGVRWVYTGRDVKLLEKTD